MDPDASRVLLFRILKYGKVMKGKAVFSSADPESPYAFARSASQSSVATEQWCFQGTSLKDRWST
jgi:hypothetical protein